MSVVARRKVLAWALAAPVVAGCAPSLTAPIGAGGEGATKRTAPYVPFDVTWMIRPQHDRKYLGVSFPGAPVASPGLDAWIGKAGKAPNLLSYRLTWGTDFPVEDTRAVWQRVMLPFVVWEPSTSTLREIAEGRDDDYVRRTAAAVRDLNVPIALSFGHEMNGDWFPWGTRAATPEEFVGAWRHVHDLFQDTGVSNVIWVWSPSVVDPTPPVPLKPYYPGDAYVDWLGLVGYYTSTGPHTYRTLFAPTVKEIRAFSRAPVLLAETASAAGARKPADIADLLRAVTGRRDVVGFVWFDTAAQADWRIDSSAEALTAFRRVARDTRFGFDVRRP
ncbi:beta-mannanase [Streptomyces viridiviolaceus]|uniref:Glycoside hydrolase family 26 protein n=1 Tax=Streptomyces viridiviolaceus TaxID=68282 RepID=A0ABW2DUQ4_9ACTN|nr:glycosyl hydrolase [Streptomyces viridiviolaceus]GHB68547.1 beta-mannanase [Streptomyces viridiviolaceus]